MKWKILRNLNCQVQIMANRNYQKVLRKDKSKRIKRIKKQKNNKKNNLRRDKKLNQLLLIKIL